MPSPARNIYKRGGSVKKRGRLVAIEGLDGSGKTLLGERVCARLRRMEFHSVLTNWNETSTLYNMMMHLNAGGYLDGPARCALGGAELAARYHYVLRDVLESPRGVVIAVKYLISAFAHALIRGEDDAYVRSVYAFASPPDLTIYVDVPPAQAAERKLRDGSFGFWECGLDRALDVPLHDALLLYQQGVFSSSFLAERFVTFQTALRELHLQLLSQHHAVVIDGARHEEDVYAAVAHALDVSLFTDSPSSHQAARQPSCVSDGRP